MAYDPVAAKRRRERKKQERQLEQEKLQKKPKSSNSGEPSSSDNLVEAEVQTHVVEDKSFSQRAKEKLSGMMQGGDANDSSSEEPKKKWNSYAKKKEMESELATLITSVLVLIVAAIPASESVKPNDDETSVVSTHITKILLRHDLMTGKFSGDALDVIAIIAVCSSWYSRAAPEIRAMRAHKPSAKPSSKDSPVTDTGTGFGEVVSPIANASRATASWLDDALANEGGA